MKRSTTHRIGLVWPALVLNVLAPVIGYARIATAQGPLTVEFSTTCRTSLDTCLRAGIRGHRFLCGAARASRNHAPHL